MNFTVMAIQFDRLSVIWLGWRMTWCGFIARMVKVWLTVVFEILVATCVAC
jgi:hypothetical protein